MSPAKHSYASVTERQTDNGQSDPYVSLCFADDTKMVAAFRGMHVSPAKHSYESVTDGQTDGRTDRRRTKLSLCVAMCRYASQATQKSQPAYCKISCLFKLCVVLTYWS